MKFGIDRLLADPALRAPLEGRRIALVAHPASVTEGLVHSLDALAACPGITLSSAFGPQHGLKGDKQDNMVETSPKLNMNSMILNNTFFISHQTSILIHILIFF